MNKWILFFVVSTLLLGCSTATNKSKNDAATPLISTDTSYIFASKEMPKSDHDLLLKEIGKLDYSKLVLVNFKTGELLKLGPKLKAAGYSLLYINEKSEVKKLNID